MKQLSCFIFTIIIVISVAEVPSYIKVCGRKNPQLDECIVNSVNSLREKLRVGIPEFEVPSIEPLLLEKGLPLADSKDLKAYATNVQLFNLHSFNVKHLHIDLENNRLDLQAAFESVRLLGNYNVTAKILVPISGSGPIEISTGNIDAKVVLRFKHVNTKKGVRLFFTEMTCKLSIEDYTPTFHASKGSDNSLDEIIGSIVSNGKEEILETITPKLEKAIASRLLELTNKICKHFTYDELFPDHE